MAFSISWGGPCYLGFVLGPLILCNCHLGHRILYMTACEEPAPSKTKALVLAGSSTTLTGFGIRPTTKRFLGLPGSMKDTGGPREG